MIRRLFNECLLRPRDIEPSHEAFEVVGVFNPGAVAFGAEVVVMVRVAERPRERREGFTGLPRHDPRRGLVIDWVRDGDLEILDPRVVRLRADGGVRLTFVSHLRMFRSADGRAPLRERGPRLLPQNECEEFGVEDPRITRIGETYYITYVAVSRHGAATALATTRDFETFERRGIIFHPENKDVVLFPRRFGGEFVALHRPNPATHFSPPEMWVARSPDLVHWGRHEPVHAGRAEWESGRIGAGTPPLEVEGGWLEVYHGNTRPAGAGGVGRYCAGVLLIDADEPARVLRRSAEPIMAPEADFERVGFVPDVVFPTGMVPRGDAVLIYYGAADTNTGVVEFALDDLLAALRRPPADEALP